MTRNLYMHDFECFHFFQNVINSKLSEAQKHLKKLEIYKTHLDLFNTHKLNEIAYIHEEQNDFITIVYQQCATWRAQSLSVGQLEKVKDLEEMTRKLESTTYHVLFIVEYIQKSKERMLNNDNQEVQNDAMTEH
jgi:hypothetical protein